MSSDGEKPKEKEKEKEEEEVISEDDETLETLSEASSRTGTSRAEEDEETGDIGDEEELDEEEMTPEQKLDAERERCSQLQVTIKGLISQFTSYKKTIDEDKERDKRRIAELNEMLEQAEAEAESSQSKIDQLHQEMDAQAQRHVAMLQAFRPELNKLNETIASLNRDLADERAAHMQTLKQRDALQQRLDTPWALENQEIRLKIVFDSGRVASATLVPENDAARAALKEENDYLRSKFLETQQRNTVLVAELDAAKAKLDKEAEDAAAAKAKADTEVLQSRKEIEDAQSALKKLQCERSSRLRKAITPIMETYVCPKSADPAIESIPAEIRKTLAGALEKKDAILELTFFDSAVAAVTEFLETEHLPKWTAEPDRWKAFHQAESPPKFADVFASSKMRSAFEQFIESDETAHRSLAFLIEVDEFAKQKEKKPKHRHIRQPSRRATFGAPPSPTVTAHPIPPSPPAKAAPAPPVITATTSPQKSTSPLAEVAAGASSMLDDMLAIAGTPASDVGKQLSHTMSRPKIISRTLGGKLSIGKSLQETTAPMLATQSSVRMQPLSMTTAPGISAPKTLPSTQEGRLSLSSRSSAAMAKRMETSFRLHSGPISSIVAVKKEVWIATPVNLSASGTAHSIIHVCDRSSSGKLLEFPIESAATTMAFHGKYVWVTSNDAAIQVIHPREKKCTTSLVGHKLGPVFDTALVGNRVWSIAADQNICVWDKDGLKLVRTIETGNFIQCLLFCNGVVWVGTASGIMFFDPGTMKQLKRARGIAGVPTMLVNKLIVADNEVWAANQNDNLVSIWDASTQTLKCTFEAKRVSCALRLGGQVWTCSADCIIRVWDIRTHSFIREIQGVHDDAVTCVAVAKGPESLLRVWSGSVDHTVCIWNSPFHSHELVETAPKGIATCAVCSKSLSGWTHGTSCCCRTCHTFAVHKHCLDLIPTNTVCPGAPDGAAAEQPLPSRERTLSWGKREAGAPAPSATASPVKL